MLAADIIIIPIALMNSVRRRQSVLEETIVVVLLDMMHLQPDAGDMDRLAMGGEAPVGLVDVVAKVTGAFDDVGGIIAVAYPVD